MLQAPELSSRTQIHQVETFSYCCKSEQQKNQEVIPAKQLGITQAQCDQLLNLLKTHNLIEQEHRVNNVEIRYEDLEIQ